MQKEIVKSEIEKAYSTEKILPAISDALKSTYISTNGGAASTKLEVSKLGGIAGGLMDSIKRGSQNQTVTFTKYVYSDQVVSFLQDYVLKTVAELGHERVGNIDPYRKSEDAELVYDYVRDERLSQITSAINILNRVKDVDVFLGMQEAYGIKETKEFTDTILNSQKGILNNANTIKKQIDNPVFNYNGVVEMVEDSVLQLCLASGCSKSDIDIITFGVINNKLLLTDNTPAGRIPMDYFKEFWAGRFINAGAYNQILNKQNGILLINRNAIEVFRIVDPSYQRVGLANGNNGHAYWVNDFVISSTASTVVEPDGAIFLKFKMS